MTHQTRQIIFRPQTSYSSVEPVEIAVSVPAEPCPISGQSRVRKPDTNPVREPLREPVTRAGAREAGGFHEFWDAFPNQTERRAAERAFAAVVAEGADGAQLVAAAKAYAQSREVGRGYVKKPANWLRDGSWQSQHVGDEPTAENEADNAKPEDVAAWWAERVARNAAMDPPRPVVGGRHIKPAHLAEMLHRKMVTREQLRAVGLRP